MKKLRRYKADGYATVLILETQDQSLMNQHKMLEAVREGQRGFRVSVVSVDVGQHPVGSWAIARRVFALAFPGGRVLNVGYEVPGSVAISDRR